MPWYRVDGNFWTFQWLAFNFFLIEESAPLISQLFHLEKYWLILPLVPFVLYTFDYMASTKFSDSIKQQGLLNRQLYYGLAGLSFTLIQAFLVGDFGVNFDWLVSLLPEDSYQFGAGAGTLLLVISFLFMIANGLAYRGFMKGDIFATSCLILIIFLVVVFVAFPVLNILIRAFLIEDAGYSFQAFFDRFAIVNLWGLDCGPNASSICGVAWSTLFLAIMTGISTTLLGLAFALIVTRTNFIGKKFLSFFSILPMITPPFVVGMALILLLGASGTFTEWLNAFFEVELGGWIYGFWGLWLAQTLSYTPIAFLVLIGVVEGVSPSMEEASQTLGASPTKTFFTISLPLMRPGLANAFLLGFIESMADLGNALVLGGDYQVLSAQIFFAIAGASADDGKAATLAIVLLIFTLTTFFIQKRWVGKTNYTTVTGKGDGGSYGPLPKLVKFLSLGTALPWVAFTFTVYVMILLGGFVETWGVDNSFSLTHYAEAFRIEFVNNSMMASGVAWDSLFTTLLLAIIAMPLTSFLGLLTGYLLSRVDFPGKAYFEFGTMLSFAIPGIVIGVSYVIAFNQAPIDLTYTGMIIVLCFVFRNMSVGVRSGIASLSQLDKGLDEASITLGATGFTTLRRIIFPLIKQAIVSSMIYSFIRSITSVSAVIFLVSADYNLSSAYIIGLVESNRFGVAIAYATALIVIMSVAILLMKLLIGDRKVFLRAQK
ncbi:iron ABC transporter permease [Marinomonas sp. SM2066]|uniref:Iron ABC transporter permease n=2 Tax=Marinomonas colpomeniae TaxID=2774408 RepID=A0ABR8NV98_9GAMM|nr:iron ABC transporter permease [Marinomonas colpomeniae]